jgi:hypothetical protein
MPVTGRYTKKSVPKQNKMMSTSLRLLLNCAIVFLEKETPKVYVLKSNYIYLLKLQIKFH